MTTQSLLSLTLAEACLAGMLYLRARPAALAVRRLRAVFVLLLLVGVPTLLQVRYPSMRVALQRDAGSIASGQWWRLVTALGVQDGGVAGSVFNLVGLAVVGTIAERVLGSRQVLVIFFLGGILSELIALSWRPIGAGNSVANFSLAGAACLPCVIQRTSRAVRIPACLAVAGWMGLLYLHDIHGAAALIGMLAGAGVGMRLRVPSSTRTSGGQHHERAPRG